MHRDLKSHNILVHKQHEDDEFSAKIGDLGSMAKQHESIRTVLGGGTLGYTAPEVTLEDDEYL